MRRISQDVLASDKGPSKILAELAATLRPRRTQEARELYLAGSREGGPLARQFGEPMSIYVLRRRSWWSILQDLDSEIKIPDLILAEHTLQNARVTEDHALMIRTSLGQVITMDGVCSELVNQHGAIHLKEKRDRGPANSWRPRPHFGKNASKSKGKGYGYAVWEDSPSHDEYQDEAYYGAEPAAPQHWDSASQRFGGFEDDTASGFYGEGPEVEYAEPEDPALVVFSAMVAEGFNEADPEGGEIGAEVLQAEAEAFVARQFANQRGATKALQDGALSSEARCPWKRERRG